MRLPKLETGGDTVSTKAFGLIEQLITEYGGDDTAQLRTELENARELLAAATKWEEYENSKTSYPRLRAAIGACRVSPQAMEQK